jgi:ComF family protein
MLSWLFRPQCAACGVLSDAPLCEGCALSLVEAGPSRDVRPLEQVATPWRFGGALASAIRRLKFTGATHVARTVAPLWSPLLAAAARASDAVVVPVPLHWRRRLRRGYDQTWLLALHACADARLARPRPVLRRTRWGPAQSTLAGAARAANVEGVFEVAAPEVIRDRAVVLVDDVVTTGSTLAAAARPLLAAGATTVIGIALARAE